MQKETKIRITSNDGDVILDDFVDSNCCQCIINNCSNKESSFVVCPKNGLVKKRLFYKRNSLGAVFICDDKEKNKNNKKNVSQNDTFFSLKSLIVIAINAKPARYWALPSVL